MPLIEVRPVKIRLLKYTFKETTYCLATTLLDSELYPETDFPDLYHARWGVEELYKVSKNIIDIENFHAKHERGRVGSIRLSEAKTAPNPVNKINNLAYRFNDFTAKYIRFPTFTN